MPDAASTPLFIGVGDPHRGDDGVGLWLAAALREQGARAVEHLGDGLSLIDLFDGERRVHLLDAMSSGRPPGDTLHIDARRRAGEAVAFRTSCHLFGVAEAVETARELGLLPERLDLWGIEGASFERGERLSPAVEAAARDLLPRLLEAERAAQD